MLTILLNHFNNLIVLLKVVEIFFIGFVKSSIDFGYLFTVANFTVLLIYCSYFYSDFSGQAT